MAASQVEGAYVSCASKYKVMASVSATLGRKMPSPMGNSEGCVTPRSWQALNTRCHMSMMRIIKACLQTGNRPHFQKLGRKHHCWCAHVAYPQPQANNRREEGGGGGGGCNPKCVYQNGHIRFPFCKISCFPTMVTLVWGGVTRGGRVKILEMTETTPPVVLTRALMVRTMNRKAARQCIIEAQTAMTMHVNQSHALKEGAKSGRTTTSASLKHHPQPQITGKT